MISSGVTYRQMSSLSLQHQRQTAQVAFGHVAKTTDFSTTVDQFLPKIRQISLPETDTGYMHKGWGITWSGDSSDSALQLIHYVDNDPSTALHYEWANGTWQRSGFDSRSGFRRTIDFVMNGFSNNFNEAKEKQLTELAETLMAQALRYFKVV